MIFRSHDTQNLIYRADSLKPGASILSIFHWDWIDGYTADHYIESELFFDNMGATGFDGMTDV